MGQSVSFTDYTQNRGLPERRNEKEFVEYMNELTKCDDIQRRNDILKLIDKKVFQNPNDINGLAREVQKITENFVQDLLDRVKTLNPIWDFNVIKSGSYYDGLRVGQPYEFDFMLEIRDHVVERLRPLPKGGLSQEFKVFNQAIGPLFNEKEILDTFGEMGKLQAEHNPMQYDYSEDTSSVDESEISSFALCNALNTDIVKTIKQMRSEDVQIVLQNGGLRVRDTNPNCCLYLKVKDVGVMVDLVPCIRIPATVQDLVLINMDLTKLGSFDPCIDYKKLVEDNLYFVCSMYNWRISYSIIEHQILNKLPEELKMSLRLLKYFSNILLIENKPCFDPMIEGNDITNEDMIRIFGYKTLLQSYLLKCTFLETVLSMNSEEGIPCLGVWDLIVLTLHKMAYVKIGELNQYLVIRKSLPFSPGFQLIFTKLSRDVCDGLLRSLGELLNSSKDDDNILDTFPMLNCPLHAMAVVQSK